MQLSSSCSFVPFTALLILNVCLYIPTLTYMSRGLYAASRSRACLCRCTEQQWGLFAVWGKALPAATCCVNKVRSSLVFVAWELDVFYQPYLM